MNKVNPELWSKAQSSGVIITCAVVAAAAIVALVVLGSLADQQRLIYEKKWDEAMAFKNQFHPHAYIGYHGGWQGIPANSPFWPIWNAFEDAAGNSAGYGFAAACVACVAVAALGFLGHGLYKLNQKLGDERADDQESQRHVEGDNYLTNKDL